MERSRCLHIIRFLLLAVVCISIACCIALIFTPTNTITPEQVGVKFGPRNTAVVQGSTVSLRCIVDDATRSNIRWYDPNGLLISDGFTLVDSHPSRSRYSLHNADPCTFNLVISRVTVADAGLYRCFDSNSKAVPPSQIQLSAELIVLESNPTCTETFPSGAEKAVLEGQLHTIECTLSFNASHGIHPVVTWIGPLPYSYSTSYYNKTVRSTVSFTANRTMNGRNWICRTNFTNDKFFGSNRDTVAPSYSALWHSSQISVAWGPKNMTAYPATLSYKVDQLVTCYADAWPLPTYVWRSGRNAERWYTSTFTTREDMVGYQLMECTATNIINGVTYTRSWYLDVYVNPSNKGPTNMTVNPRQQTYEVGQNITCKANAQPPAQYEWKNLNTSERWYSSSITIREDMIGYQRLQCTAWNTIDGTNYTQIDYLDLYVNNYRTPKNMTAYPKQSYYETGQTITCNVDAGPLPTYEWFNSRTFEQWKSNSFIIREDMVGQLSMKCTAWNTFNGKNHSTFQYFYFNVIPFQTPTNMSVSPILRTYKPKETVTCYADGWPLPTFVWQSLTSSKVWNSNSFTISESMHGYNTMRCNATNVIHGQIYTNIKVIEIYVDANLIPTNMTVYPNKATYEVGESITCYADAWPLPTYVWQSLRNSERWSSQSVKIREDMVGYQMMECSATNNISGVPYVNKYWKDVFVKDYLPNTTISSACGSCGDLTGMWTSTNPLATMCITHETFDNVPKITGFFKNGTDNIWMNIVGKTQVGSSNKACWTVVSPKGLTGIKSYTAECLSCSGTEKILAIGTTSDSQICTPVGEVNSSPQFVFYRVPPVYPCTAEPSEMRHRVALNELGKLFEAEEEK